MALDTYEEALRSLLRHEGGYSNHPADPGGPTNFGITIEDYRRYCKPDATAADVRAMRLDDAKQIYRSKYWDAMRCDELPAGLDYAVFDFGVNSGPSRSIKFLQQQIGCPANGRIDDATLAAARTCDVSGVIGKLCDERLAFLRGLKTWPVFGRGWDRRVAEVRSTALAMASRHSGAERTQPVDTGSGLPKAGVAGAAVVAAGAVTAQQAEAWPVLAAAVAVVALALLGWWTWRRVRRGGQSASP